MADESTDEVKELARVKEYLERKMEELREELSILQYLVKFVDEELAKKSFRKPPKPSAQEEREIEIAPPRPKPGPEGRIRMLRGRDGGNLAMVTITPNEIRFVVSPNITLTEDMRPFSSFLIRKVFDAMRQADEERINKGTLPPGHELDYEIVKEDNRVKEIVVRNFREEHRLREIINAVRWTLETVASKTTQT